MNSSLDHLVASPITRRTFLTSSAVVTLGGLIAACGSSGESSSATDAPADAASPPSDIDQALNGEPVEVWRDPG